MVKPTDKPETRRRLRVLAGILDMLERQLGQSEVQDTFVAHVVERIWTAHATRDDAVFYRERLVQDVRFHSDLLRGARKRAASGHGDADDGAVTAASLAERMIAAYRGVVTYPWAKKLPSARAELRAAIEAASYRGRGTGRGATSERALTALLRRVGLAVGSKSTLAMGRARLRKIAR